MRALLTALLALVSWAGAGDRPDVRRVAFSPDGTRALVLTGGVRGGSGFATAGLTVIDTGTGRTLRAMSVTSQTAAVDSVVRSLLARERGLLARSRLVPGRTSRPVYLRTHPALAPGWAEGVRAGAGVILPVRLEVRPLPSPCPYPDLLPPGEGPAGSTLSVRGQVVHMDRTLPPARRCAARSLERVDVQGDRAVFVLRAYTPGFEGPNAEPVVVAARLR